MPGRPDMRTSRIRGRSPMWFRAARHRDELCPSQRVAAVLTAAAAPASSWELRREDDALGDFRRLYGTMPADRSGVVVPTAGRRIASRTLALVAASLAVVSGGTGAIVLTSVDASLLAGRPVTAADRYGDRTQPRAGEPAPTPAADEQPADASAVPERVAPPPCTTAAPAFAGAGPSTAESKNEAPPCPTGSAQAGPDRGRSAAEPQPDPGSGRRGSERIAPEPPPGPSRSTPEAADTPNGPAGERSVPQERKPSSEKPETSRGAP
jgi:hypothetical protein